MIVLPARNEAPRVGAVVEAARRALPGIRIVVVENGSTDDTAAAARRAGAEVLHSDVGYARALRTGFIHALRAGAPWVVQMDADGQHPAPVLPTLVAGLTGADIVIGSRFVGDPGYAVPPARRLAIHALGAWATLCAGQRLLDVTSGLRAWRADAIATMVADYPEEVADANVLVRAIRLGLRVVEVSAPMAERPGGASMHGGAGSVWFAARMAALTAREGLAGRRSVAIRANPLHRPLSIR